MFCPEFSRIQISVLAQSELLAFSWGCFLLSCSRDNIAINPNGPQAQGGRRRQYAPGSQQASSSACVLGAFIDLLFWRLKPGRYCAPGHSTGWYTNVVSCSDAGKSGTSKRTTTMSSNSRATRTPRRGANDKWDEKKLMTSSKSELVKLDLVVGLAMFRVEGLFLLPLSG